MTSNRSVPELLAPAGSPESLRAALAGGADAVYFGAPVFSNRMRARNFTTEEISDAIALCHRCGAKVHVTVNIRIRDKHECRLCGAKRTPVLYFKSSMKPAEAHTFSGTG